MLFECRKLRIKALSEHLIKTKVTPNFVCKSTGDTALFICLEMDMINAVHLLLHRRADPNQASETRYQQKKLCLPLQVAIQRSQHTIARLLLGYGARTDIVDLRTGQTLVHLAANGRGGAEIARLLLEISADPLQPDSRDRLPLTLARHNAMPNFAFFLEAWGNTMTKAEEDRDKLKDYQNLLEEEERERVRRERESKVAGAS